jgi:hypothetical protein
MNEAIEVDSHSVWLPHVLALVQIIPYVVSCYTFNQYASLENTCNDRVSS